MDNKVLVNNIKRICQERQIPISQLEKDLYMSPGLISRWTKNIPAIDRIIEIADYFGISVDSIVSDTTSTHSEPKTTQRLISTLYQQTIDAIISWSILDPQNTANNIFTNKFPDFSNYAECDFFYSPFNHGYFILTVRHSADERPILTLYALPTTHSYPEPICTDYNRLIKLYEYLARRLAKQLNTLQVNLFLADFLDNASSSVSDTTESTDKITPLKFVSNASY